MNKYSIKNVPEYFESYTNDCYQNAVASCLLYKGLNPNIIFADYLSFTYDRESGCIGMNYLYKPFDCVEFSKEELNTSLEMVYYPTVTTYNSTDEALDLHENRVNLVRYIHECPDTAKDRLEELIRCDIPTVIGCDLFYLSYHERYQREHGLQHSIVVTGYDNEEGFYEVFDKYKLLNSDFEGKLPMDEINMARSSSNIQANGVIGDIRRPILNTWTEIEVPQKFEVTEDKLLNILSESYERMSGIHMNTGRNYGIDLIFSFIEDLRWKMDVGFSQRDLFMFKSYYIEAFKYVARSRQRFKAFINEIPNILSNDDMIYMSDCLTKSSKYWDLAANLSLKFAITKKIPIINDIITQLRLIRDEEMCLIEHLYKAHKYCCK